MRPYSRPRAFYDGVLSGIIIGFAIGTLFVLSFLDQNGVAVPLNVIFLVFAFLIGGIGLAAYDAHKALSAPP